jgi:serine/threonine-protein kinase
MQLAEGETLAERVKRGALPNEQALPIALQIAEALEVAHEKGIIHRDLKPANIKLTADGQIKVLDFGLAKALDPQTPDSGTHDLSLSPTLTAQMTQAGVLLGTAAYMSPEQAAGTEADQRADIWAFGTVLAEMLTGELQFQGETVSHTLASVLKDEPKWSSFPTDIPGPILDLLKRCLRKDPKRRLQSIGDARVLVEDYLEDPQALESTLDVAAEAAPPAPPRWKTLLPWAIAAGLGIAFVLSMVVSDRQPDEKTTEITKFESSLPPSLDISVIDYPALAISSDGRMVAMTAEGDDGIRRIYLRSMDEVQAREMAGTDHARAPFFSPDGEWIAYFTNRELKKIQVRGGAAVTLAEIGQNRGGSWGSDGWIYLTENVLGGIKRLPENGGELEDVTVPDAERGERTHRWPDVLPEGAAVLYTSDTFSSTEYYDDARIEAVSTSTGERRVLIEGSSMARFLTSGHLLFARAGSLYAVPFDSQTLEISDSPTLVLQGVFTSVASGAVHFAISHNGVLAFLPGELDTGRRKPVWIGRDGVTEPTGPEIGPHRQIALSPDNRQVALISGTGQNDDLWVHDLERDTTSRLTFEGSAAEPIWSPDGKHIAYATTQEGREANVHWKAADGSSEAEPLWAAEQQGLPMSFSPDGRYLLIDRLEGSEVSDIWVLDMEERGEPTSWLQSPADEFHARFSPDGRWIAYTSDESGQYEIYVRPYPGPGGRWQISNGGGMEPHWSADGRELFYRNFATIYGVEVETAGSFIAGRPEVVAEGVSDPPFGSTYAPSNDGQRFLALINMEPRDLHHMQVVVNWGAEVERLTARDDQNR